MGFLINDDSHPAKYFLALLSAALYKSIFNKLNILKIAKLNSSQWLPFAAGALYAEKFAITICGFQSVCCWYSCWLVYDYDTTTPDDVWTPCCSFCYHLRNVSCVGERQQFNRSFSVVFCCTKCCCSNFSMFIEFHNENSHKTYRLNYRTSSNMHVIIYYSRLEATNWGKRCHE